MSGGTQDTDCGSYILVIERILCASRATGGGGGL